VEHRQKTDALLLQNSHKALDLIEVLFNIFLMRK